MSATGFFKLNRNEFHFEHPREVLEAAMVKQEDLSTYATTESHSALATEVANLLNCDLGQLCLGHGAEDLLIKTLCWLRLQSRSILLSQFSWHNYRFISVGLGFECQEVPTGIERESFYEDLDLFDACLEKAHQTQVVLITSPNNPTGHTVSLEKLTALIEKFPKHFFLVDLVYDEPCSKFLELKKYKNVFLFGSFSKFFGLPGLRVGYCVSSLLPPAYQLNLGLSPSALRATLAALDHYDTYLGFRKEMLRSVEQLRLRNSTRLTFYKSFAPFVLMECHDVLDKTKVDNAVLKIGVEPKFFQFENKSFMRWGLGPAPIVERIEQFVETLFQSQTHSKALP